MPLGKVLGVSKIVHVSVFVALLYSYLELQLLLPQTRNKHLLSILESSDNNYFPESLVC